MYQLRCAVAHVAVEQLSFALYAVDPVPALAFAPLGMSAARRVDVGRAGGTPAEVRFFLRHVPVNVSRVILNGINNVRILDVAAVLRANPCHGFVSDLHVMTHIDPELAAVLVDALHGLRHLRRLWTQVPTAIADDGCATLVDAVCGRGSLRSIGVSKSGSVQSLDFSRCHRLRSLTEVQELHSLSSVLLPASLCRLIGSTFRTVPYLAEIDLSHTEVTAMGDFCVAGCYSLTTLLLPATLATVGDNFVSRCPSLTAVDLSHTALRSMGERCMYNCDKLVSLRMPRTLAVIGGFSVSLCPALGVLDLSGTAVATLPDTVGSHCSSLGDVKLPATFPVETLKGPIALAARSS
jgi:hypothetical protein